jgi:hypothetical protein
MKRLILVAMIAVLLLPGVALAGSSTDAALALGAFAVFNQVISGTGVFAGTPAVAAPAPVYYPPQPVYYPPQPVYYPPQPVYVAPPPPPVAYYPAPVIYRAPRVIYVERDKHWQKHGPGRGHGQWQHYGR